MALDNILATIKKEAESKVEKIKEQGAKEIARLKVEGLTRENGMKEKILAEAENENLKRIEQARFQLQNQKKSGILQEKQAILDEIFEFAVSKMAKMPETEQVELLSKMIKKLPSVKEGKLVPTKNSSKLVKKAESKSGTHYSLAEKATTGQGGFVFTSPEIEIDNRYSALINQVRDEAETEVANLLFS